MKGKFGICRGNAESESEEWKWIYL